VYLNPDDAAAMGVGEGDFVRVTSRRGSIELAARLSHRDTPGTCFIPFHFREAAANVLTIDEIDPHGKIPEYKFCAVKVEPAGSGVGGNGHAEAGAGGFADAAAPAEQRAAMGPRDDVPPELNE